MKTIAAAFLAGLFFVSCAPSTPQARIDRQPQVFASLSRTHQEQVRRGEVAKGMPPEAVLLAWGAPDQRFEGSKNSRRTERWDYTSTRPVYTTNYFGSYGYGYSPYHGYGTYSSLGYGLGPDVAYVPFRSASVWFAGNRVDSWERLR